MDMRKKRMKMNEPRMDAPTTLDFDYTEASQVWTEPTQPWPDNVPYSTLDLGVTVEEVPVPRTQPLSLGKMCGVFLVCCVEGYDGKFVKNKLSGWYYPNENRRNPLFVGAIYSNKQTDLWHEKEGKPSSFIIVKKYFSRKIAPAEEQKRFNQDGGIRMKFKSPQTTAQITADFNGVAPPSLFNPDPFFESFFK